MILDRKLWISGVPHPQSIEFKWDFNGLSEGGGNQASDYPSAEVACEPEPRQSPSLCPMLQLLSLQVMQAYYYEKHAGVMQTLQPIGTKKSFRCVRPRSFYVA